LIRHLIQLLRNAFCQVFHLCYTFPGIQGQGSAQ
jgi:hypothetical protein